jgi:glycerate-2-kinase
MRRLTGILLHAGAPITAINLVRSELSLLKAGGLAHAAAPARLVGLLFSDVVGDDPASIASGPTVTLAPHPPAGERTLRRIGCWDLAPPAIRAALGNYAAPPPDMSPPNNVVIARNRDMLDAAAEGAMGFQVRL